MAVLCGTYVYTACPAVAYILVYYSCKYCRSFLQSIISLCVIPSDNAEVVAALLEAGADVNATVEEGGLNLLMRAVTYGNPHIVRKIATYPGVRLDTQVSMHGVGPLINSVLIAMVWCSHSQLPDGTTAICISENLSDHKSTAILLAAGANPTLCLANRSPLHSAALNGNVA